MARLRRAISGSRRSRNRHFSWESATMVADGVTGTLIVPLGYVVLPSELENEYQDPTLYASRGVVGYRVTGSGVTSGFVGIGLIAWDDINDIVPAPADCPGPVRESDRDWILRFMLHAPTGLGVGALAQSLDGFSYLSKARRRLGRSRGLLAVAENTSGHTVSIGADFRCLLSQA